MKLKGVPQGAPFSPILAILALERTIINPYSMTFDQKAVMYADDGLIYGRRLDDNPVPWWTPDWKMSGISQNKDKSG
jgi:hypothetical protein